MKRLIITVSAILVTTIPLSAQKTLENDEIKLMPAFHYNITNNYRYHIQEGVRGSDEVIRSSVRPINWFFTFNGGLAFRF